nr:DUF551 domain-containing protein [Citrobacter sp. wls714]
MADAVKAIDELLSVRRTASQEAVYQVLDDGSWTDYSKQQLEGLLESKPSTLFRVVYPSPSLTQPVLVDEDDNFYSWFGREWEKYYQPNNYSLSAKKRLGSIAESAWFACRAAMLQAGYHNEQHLDMVDCRLPFDQWLSQQNEPIDVDCGCVTTEAFYHWLRVAYEAGNSPVTPDTWIPVSERMPDKYDFDIWVFSPSKGIHDGIQWDGCEFADDEYQFKINDVSHWMKKIYPAAPQQEVKP